MSVLLTNISSGQTFFAPCSFEFMAYALFIVQHRRLKSSQIAASTSENPNTAFPKQGFPQLYSSPVYPHIWLLRYEILPLISCWQPPTLPPGATRGKLRRSQTPLLACGSSHCPPAGAAVPPPQPRCSPAAKGWRGTTPDQTHKHGSDCHRASSLQLPQTPCVLGAQLLP